MKDDKLYLLHSLECIKKIEEYTKGGKATFMKTKMIQDATVRNLQIMTESTQHLSSDLKKRYAALPWRQLSGYRNILTHDYLELNMERIWETIEKDVPDLEKGLTKILTDLGGVENTP